MGFFFWIVALIPLIGIIFWISSKISAIRRMKEKKTKERRNLRVAFVHLDLGLGGAERLVVDAASGMIRKGNQVTIFTTNHPKDHCFPETLDMNVVVYGNWIPHHLFGGRFQTILSSIRMAWLSLCILLQVAPIQFPHVFFLDGVSSCVPILQLSGRKVRIVWMYHCEWF